MNADLLTITATSTILGEVPLFKIHIAAKIKSMSENEIVLELEEKNHAILAKFVRIPIPVVPGRRSSRIVRGYREPGST